MDVNKINFGSYTIGTNRGDNQKDEKSEEMPNVSTVVETQSVDAQAVLDAMELSGIQNKFGIAKQESKEINPSDFLSEDRILEIEAMMGKFEDGVGIAADAIEKEFPGFFTQDTKNALAAKIYAQE